MKTVAILNQKGGVGKTTSTVNIGAGLARLGKTVLLIDLDPQASLTYSLGIEPDELPSTIYSLLKHETTINEVLIKKNDVYVLPAFISLAAFEKEFADASGREFILKSILKEVPAIDYIFIDCPPSLGLLTLNALAAAQEVFIPVQTEYLALQGLSQLLETLKVVTLRINPYLQIGGIIATRYNRRNINKDIIGQLQNNFKERVFKTVIRENVAIIEASSAGLDVYRYSPTSTGACDYLLLCQEIIEREISALLTHKEELLKGVVI